jgi:hypothetical protein
MARPFVWFPSDRSGHEKTRPFGRAGRVAQGFESGQSAGAVPAGRAGWPCRLAAGSPGVPSSRSFVSWVARRSTRSPETPRTGQVERGATRSGPPGAGRGRRAFQALLASGQLLAGRAIPRTARSTGSPGEPLDGSSYELLAIGERTGGSPRARPTCCSRGEHGRPPGTVAVQSSGSPGQMERRASRSTCRGAKRIAGRSMRRTAGVAAVGWNAGRSNGSGNAERSAA